MSGERASVLMLMPAAVMVLVILGAIAVDFAVIFLGQRELTNATAAAANDAAVAALSEAAFYTAGELRVSEERAHQVARATFAGRSAGFVDGGLEGVSVTEVDGRRVQVTVTATATVEMIFSRGLPLAPRHRPIHATSTATAVEE